MFVFELFLTLDTKLCSTSAMSSVATITVKLLPSARRRHPTAAQFIEFHSLAFQLRSLEVVFVTSTKVFTAHVGERKHDPRFSGILALAPSKPGGRVCAEISCDGMCTSSSVSKHFWKKRIPKTVWRMRPSSWFHCYLHCSSMNIHIHTGVFSTGRRWASRPPAGRRGSQSTWLALASVSSSKYLGLHLHHRCCLRACFHRLYLRRAGSDRPSP